MAPVQLPKEITKNIDEIKTPSNRVLVISLFLAVIILFVLLIRVLSGSNEDNKEELKAERRDKTRLQRENDSLRFVLIQGILADNERLRNKAEYKDTVIDNLQSIKKSKDEKN